MINNNIHIIIGQLNFTVGDIEGNTKKIIGAIKKANEEYNADIIIFPELSVSSYPPEDLLLRPAFNKSINIALEKIKSATKHLLNASEICSIVMTSAFKPDRLVCEAVQTGH